MVLWGHLPYKDSRPDQHIADQHIAVLLRSPSTQFHTHSISSYCPHDSYSGRRRRSFNCFPCTHFLSVPLCQRSETRRGWKIPWGSSGKQGREDRRKKNAQLYKYIYGKNVRFQKGHFLLCEAVTYLYSYSHSSYYSHDVCLWCWYMVTAWMQIECKGGNWFLWMSIVFS